MGDYGWSMDLRYFKDVSWFFGVNMICWSSSYITSSYVFSSIFKWINMGVFHKWRYPKIDGLYVYMFMDNSPFTIWRISATPLLFGRPFCRHRPMGPWATAFPHPDLTSPSLQGSPKSMAPSVWSWIPASRWMISTNSESEKDTRWRSAWGGGDGALGVWESGSGGLIMVNNGYSCLIMAYHYYYGIIQ